MYPSTMFPFGFWNSNIWKESRKLEKISSLIMPGPMSIPKAVNSSVRMGAMRPPKITKPAAPLAPKI